MKILASSVVRAANKDEAHGGLYEVDLVNKTSEKVIDWWRRDIIHDVGAGGGDHGMRGIDWVGDRLFISGSKYLFEFNKDYELVNEFTHPLLDGTHEICQFNDLLLVVANTHDSILIFNTRKNEWGDQLKHNKGWVQEYEKGKDTIHIDSVSVHNGEVWYSGSNTGYIFNDVGVKIELPDKNTHNAQFWEGKLVYNVSHLSKTVCRYQEWKTPDIPYEGLDSTSRPGYTRGMVFWEDKLVVGTSPASVVVCFPDGSTEYIQISKDIRNSICGLGLCK